MLINNKVKKEIKAKRKKASKIFWTCVWFYLDLPKSWIDLLDRQILKYRSDTSFIDVLKNVHTEDFIDHGKIIVPILDIKYWAVSQECQLNRLLRKENSVKIKKIGSC